MSALYTHEFFRSNTEKISVLEKRKREREKISLTKFLKTVYFVKCFTLILVYSIHFENFRFKI